MPGDRSAMTLAVAPRALPSGSDDLSRVDYGAIERALTPAQRAALTDFCELLRIPRAKWAKLPALTTLFQTVAMQQLALTFKASGLSWTLALQRAADQL